MIRPEARKPSDNVLLKTPRVEAQKKPVKVVSTPTLNRLFPDWNYAEVDDTPRSKRFAIVFYAARDKYACAVLINSKRLRDLGTHLNIDIVVLIPEEFVLPRYFTKGVSDLNLIVKTIPSTFDKGVGYYENCMIKLHVFKLIEYDRVIFMDSDSLVTRRVDDLFLLPSSPLAAPRAAWLGQKETTITSWFLIIEPNEELYNTRIYEKHLKNRPSNTNQFDMDLLNEEFREEFFVLPYWLGKGSCNLGILDSWFHNINGHKNLDWLAERVYAVHFSSSKPWIKDMQVLLDTNPTPHPFYIFVWETYKGLEQELCR